MKRNLQIFFATLVITLALLTPGAIQWAFGALLLAGVMALALVGALFVIVCVAIYRNRQRETVEQPPWPAEIAATDEPTDELAPESVRVLRAKNGKL
jgi:hypothetical protein